MHVIILLQTASKLSPMQLSRLSARSWQLKCDAFLRNIARIEPSCGSQPRQKFPPHNLPATGGDKDAADFSLTRNFIVPAINFGQVVGPAGVES